MWTRNGNLWCCSHRVVAAIWLYVYNIMYFDVVAAEMEHNSSECHINDVVVCHSSKIPSAIDSIRSKARKLTSTYSIFPSKANKAPDDEQKRTLAESQKNNKKVWRKISAGVPPVCSVPLYTIPADNLTTDKFVPSPNIIRALGNSICCRGEGKWHSFLLSLPSTVDIREVSKEK